MKSEQTTYTGTEMPWLTRWLLVATFSGLLSAAFLDYRTFYLTWFAFVPLLFAIDKQTLATAYLLGLIGGACTYASGTYWLIDFLMLSKGLERSTSLLIALIVWFYCAQQIAVISVVFRWLSRYSGCSQLVVFPLVVAIMTANFPQIFAMRLGESQVNFPEALQAIEWVGVQGLDGLIALVNIAVFLLLKQVLRGRSITDTSSSNTPSATAWTIVGGITLLWFSYGTWALQAWQDRVADWESVSVGLVQSNETPTLGKTTLKAGYGLGYPPEMAITEQLAKQGAELVIWPEAQPKQYLNQMNVQQAYRSQSRELDTALLFQDTWQRRNKLTGEIESQFNSAIMLDNSGSQQPIYQKIRRMPFGEYLPWLEAGSSMHRSALRFLGPFLNEIRQGKQRVAFQFKNVNIVPIICYETTFPGFVAESIRASYQSGGTSRGTVLVGLSNDGWFGSSRQPFQHVLPSSLRAVESRVPLVHVANNGPSIVVMPSGERLFESHFRRMAGYLVDVPMPASSSLSFYSQHPYLLNTILLIVFSIVCVLALRNQRLSYSKYKANTLAH